MTEQKSLRLPLKSETGDTVGLIALEGLQLWSKRQKKWETFSFEDLLQRHAQLRALLEEQFNTLKVASEPLQNLSSHAILQSKGCLEAEKKENGC